MRTTDRYPVCLHATTSDERAAQFLGRLIQEVSSPGLQTVKQRAPGGLSCLDCLALDYFL